MPKKTDAEKKVRVTLDLSEKFYRRLETLQELVDADTKALLIREALRLYEYVAAKALEGYTFRAIAPDGTEERIVLLGHTATAVDESRPGTRLSLSYR